MGRPKQVPSRGDHGMPEDRWQDQKKRNAQASKEGRAVYVRGIPPDWSHDQLMEFFGCQGKVDGVNLLPPRAKQPARAAFVNFETYEEATSAAQVCDNLTVQDSTGASFRLVCSLKHDVGKKVDYVSGFTELSKARQEGRSLYISGLPPFYEEEQLRDLVEVHGLVEEVKVLPQSNKKTLSCFVIMASPGEAATAIEGLDGQEIEGHVIACGYPRPPKRTREADEEEPLDEFKDAWQDEVQDGLPPPPPPPERPASPPFVELRGFPFETTAESVSAAIEAGGRSVQSVRVMPEGPASCVAKVRMKTVEDSHAVVEELHNFEFMPGCFLQVSLSEASAASGQEPPVPPAPPARRPQTQGRPAAAAAGRPCAGAGAGGPRRRGRVVGRLAYDRSAYRGTAANPWVTEDMASRGPQPPSYPPPRDGARPSLAPHLQEEGQEGGLDEEL